ncbi:MAG: DUF378 domain-containing protein [Candidatus Gracilibacteria bacterium]
MKVLYWIAFALVFVGAVNWGLYGLFQLDLVAYVLGSVPVAAKVVYTLVGVSGIYLLVAQFVNGCCGCDCCKK